MVEKIRLYHTIAESGNDCLLQKPENNFVSLMRENMINLQQRYHENNVFSKPHFFEGYRLISRLPAQAIAWYDLLGFEPAQTCTLNNLLEDAGIDILKTKRESTIVEEHPQWQPNSMYQRVRSLHHSEQEEFYEGVNTFIDVYNDAIAGLSNVTDISTKVWYAMPHCGADILTLVILNTLNIESNIPPLKKMTIEKIYKFLQGEFFKGYKQFIYGKHRPPMKKNIVSDEETFNNGLWEAEYDYKQLLPFVEKYQ